MDKAHSHANDFAVFGCDLSVADFALAVDTAHKYFHCVLLGATHLFSYLTFQEGIFLFSPCLQTYNMIYCVPKSGHFAPIINIFSIFLQARALQKAREGRENGTRSKKDAYYAHISDF